MRELSDNEITIMSKLKEKYLNEDKEVFDSITHLEEYTIEYYNLILYLEDKINICNEYIDKTRNDMEEVKYTLFAYDNLKQNINENIKKRNIYQDILERVKSSKYE